MTRVLDSAAPGLPLPRDPAPPDDARGLGVPGTELPAEPADRRSPQDGPAHLEAAMLTTLLQDAPVGLALIDASMRFVRVNNEIAAMNGLPVDAHPGAAVFELLPGLRASAEPLLRDVLSTGRPVRDVRVTGQTHAEPGVDHTWLESFFPVHLPDGQVGGVAAIARDVTEVLRLERELARTLQRQARALHELQESLLPSLPQVPGADLAASYLAASSEVHLGGDWYDALLAPDGGLVLCVGDVVGHGLPAVGAMARLSGALRAYVCEGLAPAALLQRLDVLLDHPSWDCLASAVVVMVDLATGEVEYAAAGHPYALLRDGAGRVGPLDQAQGPLLGVASGSAYATGRAVLPPGGALLLHSDGLVERRGESLDEGVGRLVAGLTTAPSGARALVDTALGACLTGRERADDVCLLAVVRSGS